MNTIKKKPKEGSIEKETKEGLKIYLYPSVKFTDEEEIKCKILIVVGETGSGKTTLLNSLVNYIEGVELEDDFRYIIINEDNIKREKHESQTEEVNIYYIKAANGNPPLKIIDTPGFGDTRGISFDQEIPKKLEVTFKTQIDRIHAVCFVGKSSDDKLSATQKYIFSSIFDLFGKDIGENIIAMITFADGNTPNILQCLENDHIFKELIKVIRPPFI